MRWSGPLTGKVMTNIRQHIPGRRRFLRRGPGRGGGQGPEAPMVPGNPGGGYRSRRGQMSPVFSQTHFCDVATKSVNMLCVMFWLHGLVRSRDIHFWVTQIFFNFCIFLKTVKFPLRFFS